MTSCQGNLLYQAPECFRGEHYTSKADVFSFAIVSWEIFSSPPQRPHFELNPQKAAFESAINGTRPAIEHAAFPDQNIEKVVVSAWAQDPNLRPSFREILLSGVFDKQENAAASHRSALPDPFQNQEQQDTLNVYAAWDEETTAAAVVNRGSNDIIAQQASNSDGYVRKPTISYSFSRLEQTLKPIASQSSGNGV